ncbi:MAG: uracil-DNA glycosylase [Anaerolineae bacterium]
MSIERFVTRLKRIDPPTNCINPWRGRSAAAKLRQANLTDYLEQMALLRPTVILVGEAPGYRGCGLTGVPFTSERILVEGAAGLFGADSSFKIVGDYTKPLSEASATIVWEILQNYPENLPLIWNACPFHPHKLGNERSNRAPNQPELVIGIKILGNLLNLFPDIKTVVAVGNRADEIMSRHRITHLKIRHPSHGGKKEFQAGVEQIFTDHLNL